MTITLTQAEADRIIKHRASSDNLRELLERPARFNERAHKYHARRTEYDGHTYDSAAEASHAAELDLRLKARAILSWTPQVPFPLLVNGTRIGTYRADFLVFLHDDTQEAHEVKGFETPLWRRSRKHFEAQYPDIKLVIVKAR
jgi:hypothetical protein